MYTGDYYCLPKRDILEIVCIIIQLKQVADICINLLGCNFITPFLKMKKQKIR